MYAVDHVAESTRQNRTMVGICYVVISPCRHRVILTQVFLSNRVLDWDCTLFLFFVFVCFFDRELVIGTSP